MAEVKKYPVQVSPQARKKIESLDAPVRRRITTRLEEIFQDCKSPFLQGRPLTEPPIRLWRYRVGDYRIVAQILADKIIILVVNINSRDEIIKECC